MQLSNCATCQHYAKPGKWSARCQLIPYDFTKSGDWNEAHGIRRADNSCEQYEAPELEIAAPSESRIAWGMAHV